MKKDEIWWLLAEIYGYSVVISAFFVTFITIFLSQQHNYSIMVYTNKYGEYIIELYILVTGFTAFLVSLWHRFRQPRV